MKESLKIVDMTFVSMKVYMPYTGHNFTSEKKNNCRQREISINTMAMGMIWFLSYKIEMKTDNSTGLKFVVKKLAFVGKQL